MDQIAALRVDDYLFPSRLHASPHLGTRQNARIVGGWVDEIGLDPPRGRNALDPAYQANLDLPANEKPEGRAAAPWPHELESTVRYLGIEVDDALEIAEQTEV